MTKPIITLMNFLLEILLILILLIVFFLANAQGLRLDQISAFENESVTDAYVDIGNTFGYPHQQAFLGMNHL